MDRQNPPGHAAPTPNETPPEEPAAVAGTSPSDLAFLADCGEMGCLIAAFDWSSTPLGPIADWPPSLRTVVSLILRTPLSMALLWGERGIMIYNQHYAIAGGRRHPALLGCPVIEAWPEAADFNREVLHAGLSGQSLSFKDRRFTLVRNGTAEDIWLDLAYSPVPGETGRPAGVLVVVTDTTVRNLADQRLRLAQEAGGIGTFEWYPQTNRMVVSDVYRQVFGLSPDEDVTDLKLLERLLPEDRHLGANPRRGQTANPLTYAEFRIRHSISRQIRWIARRGEVLEGGPAAPQSFIGVAWDITEQKTAERREAFFAALSERLLSLTDATAVVATTSQMLGEYLGVGRVGYGEVDPTGVYVATESDWTTGGLPSMAGRHVLASFGATVAAALHRGEPVRIDDVLTDPRFTDPAELDALAALQTRSRLVVPLIRNGRLAATLYAHCAEPRVWTDADEALLHAVAARTWDAAQRVQAEQRVRDSAENFRLLAEAMPIHVWVNDPSGRTVWVNQQAYTYTGQTPDGLRDDDWGRLVHPDDRESSFHAWTTAIRDGVAAEYEYRIRRHDGIFRWHLARVLPIRDAAGSVVRWIGTNTDIDDQRRALADLLRLNVTLEERVEARTQALRETEEALRQAQKMEAIGQLTGGIAHDFNNLLAGILGALELVQRRLVRYFPPGDSRLTDLDRFMHAASGSAQRAAALTHRLLTFARRQSLDRRATDVAALMHGMADMLRRTLGEQIVLRIETWPDLWDALTDANQLESAILNLGINARDAMPEGGQLTIGAANVVLDRETRLAVSQLEPGEYVVITVADTGTGMSEEIIEKAFEPFFTTKPTGQGTGLGLSMVYGFIRQSGGHVHIASRIGQGTVVTLYVPRAAVAAKPSLAPSNEAPLGAGQTILVVEDVPAVRMLLVETLCDLGYQVIEAADASGALPVIDSPRPIDLLVSDVGLPGLNGRQIADYARARRPGLKVLFVTGYAGDAVARSGGLEEGMAMMTKPFAIEQLAAKLNEMLGHR